MQKTETESVPDELSNEQLNQQEISPSGANPRRKKNWISKTAFSFDTVVYPWSSPIPVVFVEGTGSEMGAQFTKATKSITERNVSFNLPTLEKILKKANIRKKDYVSRVEEAIRKYTTAEYLDEMQAISEVINVPYESIVLLNSNVDILYAMPSPDPHERFFCSMFAAWGKATSDGSTIAGHNDDGGRIMDQYSVLKIAKPKHGFAFVCPQTPGYLAYDCQVNSAQLFCCGTAVDDKMKNSQAIRDGVPNWIMYRWLGQYASDTEDAVKKFHSAKNNTLKNWCFISRDQGGRVIEATPKNYVMMNFPSKSKDWIGVSTCIVSEKIAPYVMRSKEPTSGDYRQASVRREVSKRYGDIDSDSAIEILSSHYDSLRKREMASEHTPCRHMEYENKFAGTCRSIIATFRKENEEPTTRIDVSLGNPCNGYWRSLEFDRDFNVISGYDEKDELEKRLGRALVAM